MNRSRQLKNKFSRCLNFRDAVEVDPKTTSAKCNRILHQQGSPAVGLNLKDTLIIYPPQHQKIRTEPGNQKKILAAVRFSEDQFSK